jgi:sugar phosphate isomerase/epimerase
MQYDIYHMQMMGDKPDEFIARYADKIGHIQFADCPGRGQPGSDPGRHRDHHLREGLDRDRTAAFELHHGAQAPVASSLRCK